MASIYFYVTSSRENSAELQRFLFDLGTEWTSSGRTVLDRHRTGILVGNIGEPARDVVMYGGTPGSAYREIEWESEDAKEEIKKEYKAVYRKLRGKQRTDPGKRVKIYAPGGHSYRVLSTLKF